MEPDIPALKADLFRGLAHPARIRILELLAARERSGPELQDALGLDQPNVSQHLAALRARHLVAVRREGTTAFYTLASRLTADLLRVARELLSERLTHHQSVLRELRREGRRQ